MLGAHSSTHTVFIIEADGKDAIPITLAQLIVAQIANYFCLNATRHLDQDGTDFTLNKEKELLRRALIDGDLQNLVLQPHHTTSLTYHLILFTSIIALESLDFSKRISRVRYPRRLRKPVRRDFYEQVLKADMSRAHCRNYSYHRGVLIL